MGACTSHSKKQSLVQNDKFDQEPDDISEYFNKELPNLVFHSLISKVKLKNMSHKSIRLRITIDEFDQFTLLEKSTDLQGHIKWDIEQKIIFTCNEYELRKKFMTIEVIHEEKVLGSIRINLYLIAVGPYHLDFEMVLQNTDKVRVSMDFKIAQVVSIKIEPHHIEMLEVKQFVGDQYAFTLKSIVGNSLITQPLSSVCEISRASKTKTDEQHSSICWEIKDTQKMPIIETEIPFYKFHYATLKIMFWRIDKLNGNEQNENQIFGECYVPFVKILSFNSQMINKGTQEFEQKNVTFSEKLWNHGVSCGKIKAKLNVEVQKHLKQMLVCVRTEKGISKSSPVFQSMALKTKSSCKQIVEIIKISQKMAQQQAELQKNSGKNKTYQKKKDHYRSISEFLAQLLTLLQSSHKQTIKFYSYSNESQLIKGQLALIQVGNRLIRYMDESYQLIQTLKWKVLGALIVRGEFMLNHIGFNTSQVGETNRQIASKKISVALKYQDLLYKLLGLTFKILAIKRYDEERIFAQKFCAIAYFRIPEFRKQFLSLISHEEDPEIEEWRGTDFSLKSRNEEFRTFMPGENTFQLLFDWQTYFYGHIKGTEHYEIAQTHLAEIIAEEEWQKRIYKRRGAFFSFIKQWVKYVQGISVRLVHTNWKYFQGYVDIIRSFLVQMKQKPIKQYPSSIKVACKSLLANENLLNIFTTIVFKKTNINNSMDVYKILEMTYSFFEAIKEQNKRIPSIFHYPFFFTGIKMILENQYSLTTAKALFLLYEHFQLFSHEFKIELSNYLLGRIFFKLFFHWSFNVRIFFHHMMIIKIYYFFTEELGAISKPSQEAINRISQRYNKLLIMVENLDKMKSRQFVPSYEKQLHKKLKKKIYLKKKNQMAERFKPKPSLLLHNKNQNLEHSNDNFSISDVFLNSQADSDYRMRAMDELSKPTEEIERYDSQIITRDITLAIKNQNSQLMKKDKVIRNRKHQTFSPTKLEGSEINGSASKIFRSKFNSPEQTALPILSQENIKYATIAWKEFKLTSQMYLKNLNELKGAPKIKVEMTLDSNEMSPEDYKEIEQW